MELSIRRSVIGVFAAAAVAAAAFTLTSPALASSEPEPDGLSVQEQALLNSDDYKIVTLDPTTGDVVSVEASTRVAMSRAASKNDCSASRTCWYGWRSPHAYWRFSGTGTDSGTWPNRGDLNTENRAVKACWSYAGNSPCSVRTNANSLMTWGVEVVGKSVTRY